MHYNFAFKKFTNSRHATLKTAGEFNYQSDTLENAGKILSAGNQSIHTNTLNNSGLMATSGKQNWQIGTLNNASGAEINAAKFAWELGSLNNHGAIFHTGEDTLNIHAQEVENRHAVLGQSSVSLPNQAAQLSANQPSSSASATQPSATTQPTNESSHIHVSGRLKNQGESGHKAAIVSNQSVNLTVNGNLLNAIEGNIHLQNLHLTGNTLKTEAGSQLQAKEAKLEIQTLQNAGSLLSEQDLKFENLATFQNDGTIGTLGKLTIQQPDRLENNGALKSEQLDLQAHTFINQKNGNIQTADQANISSKTTLRNDGKIAAKTLSLNIPALENYGSVFAHNDYTDALSIRNDGALSGAKQLSFSKNPLTNTGNIFAYDINISTPQFTNSGMISAQHNLDIFRPNSWYVSGNLSAGNRLYLNINGTLNNSTTIGGVQETRIDAHHIDNDGKILSENHVNLNASSLNNSGLINSSGTTKLAIDSTIHNHSSGRIYGDDIQINTHTLNNSATTYAAHVIAGRRSVNIQAENIHNTAPYLGNNAIGALIKSDGNLHIGGKWGRASQIYNLGSTIESGGNMSLSANQILNQNVHIRKELKKISEKQKTTYQRIHQHGRVPYGEIYDSDEHNIYVQKGGDQELIIDGGKGIEDFVRYKYKETILEDRAVESQPGMISVGGNLTTNSHLITNDKSKILVGGTFNELSNVQNIDLKGNREIIKDGFFDDKYVVYHRLKHHNKWRYNQPYNDKKLESNATIPLTETKIHTVINPSGQRAAINSVSVNSSTESVNAQIKTLDTISLNLPKNSLYKVDPNDPFVLVRIDPDYVGGVVADFTPGITPKSEQREKEKNTLNTTAAKVQTAMAQPSKNIAHMADAKTTAERINAIDLDMKQQHQAQIDSFDTHFKQAVNPDAAYQHPVTFGIDMQKVALSAPYVPAAFNDNPNLKQSLHKRLGDTYTEMHLIQAQIAALSGRQAFSGDNALETYKALINNDAQFAQKFQLTPGSALTAEQMTKLTTDIVWFVNQEITLADGSKQSVSVPKVYLRAQKGDIDGRYTYISANRIIDHSKTGKIENDAIFHARQLIDIDNASVRNRGTMSAGMIHSQNSGTFDNREGEVKARTVLDIQAQDIVAESSTREHDETIGIR
ncbi:hypothetical protein, partial [Suttonella ornithocola]